MAQVITMGGIPSAEAFGALAIVPIVRVAGTFGLTSSWAQRRDASTGATFASAAPRSPYVVPFYDTTTPPAPPPMPEPDATMHGTTTGQPHQRALKRFVSAAPAPVFIGKDIYLVRD